MDKTIHKHLDKMDDMRANIEKDIDSILADMDIDEIINDPEGYLLGVAEIIKNEVVDKYAEKAVGFGEEVAKAIENKDEIIVDESNNPAKNKELLNDQSRS